MSTQSELTEAIAARHALMTGKQKVSVSIATGGGTRSITYTRATLQDLNTYIAQLQRDLAGVTRTRNRISYFVPD